MWYNKNRILKGVVYVKRIIPICNNTEPCPLKHVENGIIHCLKPNEGNCPHKEFKKRITFAIAEDMLVSPTLTDEEIEAIIKEKAKGADFLWTDILECLFE